MCPKCHAENSMCAEIVEPGLKAASCKICGYVVYDYKEPASYKHRQAETKRPIDRTRKHTIPEIRVCKCHLILGTEPCGKSFVSKARNSMYHPDCKHEVIKKQQREYQKFVIRKARMQL